MNPEASEHQLTDTVVAAEIRLGSDDLKKDLPFFTDMLGFRLEQIFPADDPAIAVIAGHGIRLRLERGIRHPVATLRLLCKTPPSFARRGGTATPPDDLPTLTAPNGTVIEFTSAEQPMITPPTRHSFVVRRLADQAPWVIGRAGMHYRDLIPDRLGGRIIASHIRIPDGGPVPDMVHYHTVGFQLIYCYRGWVRLVYEDQGPPFILGAGDCVIQPPEIRHRVLESSDALEVIEVGVPAEHITTIDHNMELPTNTFAPDRDFAGQKFCHHKVAEAHWKPARVSGFQTRDTGIANATNGVANVQINKRQTSASNFQSPVISHDNDILFSFVMEGSVTLEDDKQTRQSLTPGDAFVIPPHIKTRFVDCSADLEILEVALPGIFNTTEHPLGQGLQ